MIKRTEGGTFSVLC